MTRFEEQFAASEIAVFVKKIAGTKAWECDVWVKGKWAGGGTGPTIGSSIDVALDILYGDTNDHLNGDFGHAALKAAA